METIVTAICDAFPERLRRNHRHVLTLTCSIFFGVGIIFCSQVTMQAGACICGMSALLQAGMYMVQLMDYFAATWSLLIIGFFECIVVGWVYGRPTISSCTVNPT